MNRIVAFALKQQALMVALFVFVCAAGLVSFLRLNIEAYPDPVPPLVDIVTQNPGQSPRRWSATSPFRWKSRWRGFRMLRRSERFRCSACRT